MNLPPLPEKTKENEDKQVDDRILLGGIEVPPKFIRTDLQLQYYRDTLQKIKKNGTVLQNVDADGLGMLALNLAIVDECMADIADKGIHIEVQGDRNVVTKKNPAVDMLDKAQSAIRFYLKEFKMTPNSRGKTLGGGGNPAERDDDEFDKV